MENNSVYTFSQCHGFNNIIDLSIFPAGQKLVYIIPPFENGSKNSKEKYRPVSILPDISKIYER